MSDFLWVHFLFASRQGTQLANFRGNRGASRAGSILVRRPSPQICKPSLLLPLPSSHSGSGPNIDRLRAAEDKELWELRLKPPPPNDQRLGWSSSTLQRSSTSRAGTPASASCRSFFFPATDVSFNKTRQAYPRLRPDNQVFLGLAFLIVPPSSRSAPSSFSLRLLLRAFGGQASV
jgi:hypothetical protein